MAQFDHPNIVALIGVVSKQAHVLRVVIQHCDKGSLKALLSSGAWPTRGMDAGGTPTHRGAALRVVSQHEKGKGNDGIPMTSLS